MTHEQTPRTGRLAQRVGRARELLWWRVVMPLRYPTRTVRVEGFRVRVHRVGEWIARQLITNGSYEQHEIRALCELVQPGDTALDIGANIGLHTLYLSRAVGPTGAVHAFEPDPENLALLRRNVERNGCTNVVIHPYGLSSESGVQTLYVCKGNKGYQSLARMEWSTSEIAIELRRGSDVLRGVHPTVMKLDVEGAEPKVLAGFDDWPPAIVFEFVPAQLRSMGEDPIVFLQTLVDRGYSLELLTAEGREATTPTTMTALADASGADYNIVACLDAAA